MQRVGSQYPNVVDDTSAKALIQNLNWPTLNDIIGSKTATAMYKSLDGFFYCYFNIASFLEDVFNS